MLSHSVVSSSLQPYGLQPTRLLCPWDFPGKNTGVGCHFLLQEIFPTQESSLHLLHWQVDSLPLCRWGSLDIIYQGGNNVEGRLGGGNLSQRDSQQHRSSLSALILHSSKFHPSRGLSCLSLQFFWFHTLQQLHSYLCLFTDFSHVLFRLLAISRFDYLQ